ncbi:MAG: RNA polymerase sigma factor [Ferruginibacter sp.]
MPEENLHTYQSFEELYHAYKSIVYNTCLSYVQQPEDAEEITQNVFIEVNNSLHRFRGESLLKTWIYRIAINKSLDHLKYRSRKKRFGIFSDIFSGNNSPAEATADFHHPGVALENKEKSAILFKAINQLPENQKTAFILSKIEGLGNIEISEVLKKNVGAVESLLSRAGDNLRKQLSSLK